MRFEKRIPCYSDDLPQGLQVQFLLYPVRWQWIITFANMYQVLSILYFTSVSYWVLNSSMRFFDIPITYLKLAWVFYVPSKNVLSNQWCALWLKKYNILILSFRLRNTGLGSMTYLVSENLGFVTRFVWFQRLCS